MAGDVFRKVATGDPLRIAAAWHNAVTDLVRDSRRDRANGFADLTPPPNAPGLVLVQNNSGSDRQRFEVLGLSSVTISPTDNLPEFQNRPAFVGVTPTVSAYTGKFAICADMIKAGSIGRAFVFGITPVQVNIKTVGDTSADVSDSDPTQLASGSSGAAQIIYLQNTTSTGKTWAIVRFGGTGAAIPKPDGRYIVYTPIDDSLVPVWTDARFSS